MGQTRKKIEEIIDNPARCIYDNDLALADAIDALGTGSGSIGSQPRHWHQEIWDAIGDLDARAKYLEEAAPAPWEDELEPAPTLETLDARVAALEGVVCTDDGMCPLCKVSYDNYGLAARIAELEECWSGCIHGTTEEATEQPIQVGTKCYPGWVTYHNCADLERVTLQRDEARRYRDEAVCKAGEERDDWKGKAIRYKRELTDTQFELAAAQAKLARVGELVSHGTAKEFRQWAETYQNRGSYSDARLSRWCADLLDILNEEQT